MSKSWWWGGVIVVLAGPLRLPLESSMALHMLVQLPLLGVAGWQLWPLMQARLASFLQRWDPYGIAGLLAASMTVMLWMLPRSLDAALNEPRVDAMKFATMIMLVGMAMRWSWPRLSMVIRGVVWSNLIAMLLVMSWLLIAAPVRVCNNYGVAQQTLAGYALLAISLVLSLWLAGRAFYCAPETGYGDKAQEARS